VPRPRNTLRHGRAAARVVSGTRAVPDCTQSFVPVVDWLGGEGRDPSDAAEKRADALLAANRGILRDFGVIATVARRRSEPGLLLQTSTRIGAIPLLSPVSGRPDFGLVVEPRFSWSSAGEMLSATGFKVVPELLPLPELPQSERRVPPWVLSSIVLPRLRRLLNAMQRRFVVTEEDVRTPRGAVNWEIYVAQRIPHGRAIEVPCRFPDLRNDEELRSAIHWVTRRHRESLLSQTTAGMVVRRLLLLCDELLALLAGSSPRVPPRNLRGGWHRMPIATRVFREGLQAIDWTVDERGLAGLSDLAGLAWSLDMEVFFEAWVETIAEHAARRTGCRTRAGRLEETRVPLDWQPYASGSQRSLLPDVVVQRDDVVVILDAKYKRHAEQIERLGWHDVDKELREEHRGDVLQALAYSTLFDAPRVVACLAYPAGPTAWHRLVQRGRHVSRARVRTGARRVELALVAMPLSGDVAGAAREVEQLVREAA
jgi:hypothetical protein